MSSSGEGAKAALARVSGQLEVRPLSELFLPVLPALRPVVPGLRRGQVVQADAGALAMALTAEASAEGAWCAVVGVPDYGVQAAATMGCHVERLVLVDEPGGRWVDVVAALAEAVDVVVARPPAQPSPAMVRRLAAVVRKAGCCLLVTGAWEGAMVRLRVASSLWVGVGDGHGHLRGRRVKVVAEGRAAGGRPRSTWLWLPGPDGRVSGADLVVAGQGRVGTTESGEVA